MRLPLIDLDEEIARAAGKTIPEIFAQEGEAGFRARETAALERALAREDGVIATGGGIVTRAENIRMMREKGFVVWLCRPLEDMIADVRQDTRPNLAATRRSACARCTGGGSGCTRRRRIYPLTTACRRRKRRKRFKSC
ncbi:MAG: shikimate kinase [Christensenellales bacterium]